MCTAADLLRLARAVARPPDSRLGRAIARSLVPRARMGPGLRVGLGWMISRRRDGPPAVWHNGGTGGFRTIVAVVPDRATGAVALATSARPPDGAAMWLLERLTEAAAPAS